MRNFEKLGLVALGSMTILIVTVILGVGVAVFLDSPKIVIYSLLSPIVSAPVLWFNAKKISNWLDDWSE